MGRNSSGNSAIKLGTFPTDEESVRRINSKIKGVSDAEAAALANAVAAFGGDNDDSNGSSPRLSQKKNGNGGTSDKKRRASKSTIWDYPDPLEPSGSTGGGSQNASDSNKEVWLDVPNV